MCSSGVRIMHVVGIISLCRRNLQSTRPKELASISNLRTYAANKDKYTVVIGLTGRAMLPRPEVLERILILAVSSHKGSMIVFDTQDQGIVTVCSLVPEQNRCPDSNSILHSCIIS